MRSESTRVAFGSFIVLLGVLVLLSAAAPAAAQKGNEGEKSPSPSPSPTPSHSPTPTPADQTTPEQSPSSAKEEGVPEPTPTDDEQEIPPPLTPSAFPYGPYDNSSLVALASRLRGFGFTEQQVHKRAFAPFIIAGPARWENSWGALRQDPDETLRRHVGQDVFCDFGAPVLAAERGRIQFGWDPLGGLIARLHREEGGYFYYAHLSGYNDEHFSSGDRVSVGDVIGYCGDSGNAEGTSPHVHFGYYLGGPHDPMGFLIDWRDRAEHRARKALQHLLGSVDRSTFSRRLGDELVPGLVVGPSGHVREPVEAFLDKLGLMPDTWSATTTVMPPLQPLLMTPELLPRD